MAEQDSIIYISDGDSTVVDDSGIVDSYSMRYTTAFGEINETTRQTLEAVREDDDEEEELEGSAMDLRKVKAEEVDTPLRAFRRPVHLPRGTLTPKSLGDLKLKCYSPEQFPIPDIVIIPPSIDRKRVVHSDKTPSRTTRFLVSTPLRSRVSQVGAKSVTGGRVFFLTDPVNASDKKTDVEKNKSFKERIASKAKKSDLISARVILIIFPVPVKPDVSLGRQKHSPLLSPRNRTIGKKSPGSGQKYSAQKIKAIISDSGIINGTIGGRGTPVLCQGRLRKDRTYNVSPVLLKTPTMSCIALNRNLSKSLTPSRQSVQAKKSPLEAKGDPSPGLEIRGVRLNRQFKLLMQFRNNVGGGN